MIENNKTYNLIYHMYIDEPNNLVLKYNLYLLKQHLKKFNGKKIIHVSFNTIKDVYEIIKIHFSDYNDIEWVFTENSRMKYPESYAFINELLPRIQSNNINEFTFMAHAKGVTRYKRVADDALFLWIHTLYEKNLQNIKNISNILEEYACCGTLKYDIPFFFQDNIGLVPWHYSGAFFWFNNKKLFSRPDWKIIPKSRYDLETYLAKFFTTQEAFGIPPFINGDTHKLMYWAQTYTGL